MGASKFAFAVTVYSAVAITQLAFIVCGAPIAPSYCRLWDSFIVANALSVHIASTSTSAATWYSFEANPRTTYQSMSTVTSLLAMPFTFTTGILLATHSYDIDYTS